MRRWPAPSGGCLLSPGSIPSAGNSGSSFTGLSRGDPAQAAPGEVLAVGEEGIAVACGGGSVLVTEVQPEGKAVMRAADFARGYRVAAGERWGRSA